MRAYLDHNASAPLRAEAKAAMIAAMDVVGNASSVHAEGRAVRGLIENARAEIAGALGADGASIVFTSGATEAAALGLRGREFSCAGIEHEAVAAWCSPDLACDSNGCVSVDNPEKSALQHANSETGVIQALPAGIGLSDMTQSFGKYAFSFNWTGARRAIISAHKLGGPKGIGALILEPGCDVEAMLRGGGQEQGRRAGTEAVLAIAGFAAAAKAAQRDLANGVWEQVAARRDALEARLCDVAPELIVAGREAERLRNTSCLILPGWSGETQVMQMDLAGFAISAGSACSSGKLRPSSVLAAMGFDEIDAKSAIRVSIGPDTDDESLNRFAKAWENAYLRRRDRNC